MTCNLCGSQEATIHLTEIINHQMIEIHLCEACAQEKGTDFKTHFQAGGLMASLLSAGEAVSKSPSEKRPLGRCPECGITYEEFGQSGRLGCAFCYEAFAKLLNPLIKRVQRTNYHVGKIPSRTQGAPAGNSAKTSGQNDLKMLQDRLRKSIQQEAFEEAARLRDEIKQVEEKTKKSKKSKNES